MNRYPRIALLLVTTVSLASCGVTLTGRPSPPATVTASTEQTEQITVEWSDVEGAGVYYVYRSVSDEGPWGMQGEYGTIPYRTVTSTRLVDVDVDPITYYYRVGAGDVLGATESDLSQIAAGKAVVEEPEWQPPALLALNTTTIDVVADNYSDTARGYVLSVANEEAATPVVRRIERDGTVTVLGELETTVDGTVRGTAAVAAADGFVYLAALGETTGTPSIWRYGSEAEGWTLWSAAFGSAATADPMIRLAATAVDDLVLAYKTGSGTLASYHVDPQATVISGITSPVAQNLSLAAYADEVVLAYQPDNDTILGTRLSDTSWSSPVTLAAGTDVAEGLLVSLAVDPAGGDAYLAYQDDAPSISVLRWSDDTLASLPSPPGTVSAPGEPPEAGAARNLSLAADPTGVYLFSADTEGSGEDATTVGVVRKYSFSSESWSKLSPDGFTLGGELETLTIAARNQILYTGYIESAISVARSYR